MIGSQDKNLSFVGQAVSVPGTYVQHFKEVPEDQRIELPVFEDTQMGMSLGLTLAGKHVLSVFSRWNFCFVPQSTC